MDVPTTSVTYHCFRWQGRCDLMRNLAAQEDPTLAVPPGDVTGWGRKPATLFVDSHSDPSTALDWLWHQMRHITTTVTQTHPAWPAVDIAADLAELRAELLGREAACEWLYRLPGDACFLAAVIALPARD